MMSLLSKMQKPPVEDRASKSDSFTCCVVLVAHIFILIVIGVALTVRYAIYRDFRFDDMPSDMRILQPPHPSFFCHHMSVASLRSENELPAERLLQGGKVPRWPRERKSGLAFDLYMLPEGHPISTRRRLSEFFFEDELLPGKFGVASFNLFRGSSLKTRFCKPTRRPYAIKGYGLTANTQQGADNLPEVVLSEEEFLLTQHSGYWFYVIKGATNFGKWKHNHNSRAAPCAGGACWFSMHIFDNQMLNCSGPNPENPYSLGVNEDDTYYFVFSLSQKIGVSRGGRLLSSPILVGFHMDRAVPDVSSLGRAICQDVVNCSMSTSGNVVVDMAYYGTSKNMLSPDDTITIVYSCSPNTWLYIGLFVTVPVAVLIVCILVAYRQRHQRQKQALYSALQKKTASINHYGAIPRSEIPRELSFA